MVSKKDIKGLGFNSIEEYFEYILLSEINGNRTQVYDLINKLSSKQKKDCYQYLKENSIGRDAQIVINILIQSL